MKILNAVIAFQGEPYTSMQNTIKNTYGSLDIPEIEIAFYYGIPLKENTNIDYYFNVSEGFENMGRKNILAFEHFLNKDFDFLFRTNSSSYVNPKELLKWLKDKPMQNFYSGVEAKHTINFMHGNGIILSRDLVKKIVDNKNLWDHSHIEDVALGKMMTFFNIPFFNNFCSSYFNHNIDGSYDIWQTRDGKVNIFRNINELEKNHFENIFHFRCKHTDPNDRKRESALMKKLHKILY